jgi:hypothetical protein
MQMLLEKPGFDINHIDYLGFTVLSYACRVGDLRTVQVSQSNWEEACLAQQIDTNFAVAATANFKATPACKSTC